MIERYQGDLLIYFCKDPFKCLSDLKLTSRTRGKKIYIRCRKPRLNCNFDGDECKKSEYILSRDKSINVLLWFSLLM